MDIFCEMFQKDMEFDKTKSFLPKFFQAIQNFTLKKKLKKVEKITNLTLEEAHLIAGWEIQQQTQRRLVRLVLLQLVRVGRVV